MSSRIGLLIALSVVTALVLAGAALGMVLLRPQPLLAAPSTTPVRELTVVGKGVAQAAPDVTIVTLGVHTQAAQAQDALRANNERMQALLARLKDLGLPDAGIETSNFSLWSNQEGPNPEAVSYRVDNAVTVTLSGVDKAGGLLQQVVAAGASESHRALGLHRPGSGRGTPADRRPPARRRPAVRAGRCRPRAHRLRRCELWRDGGWRPRGG